MTTHYTIGQLANAAGANVETIRYYERRGLIAQPPKPAQGYRTYPEATLTRILFIKRAQELAEGKLVSVRGKSNDLCRLERVLAELVIQCRSTPENAACPIVESLQSIDPPVDAGLSE